MRKNLLFFTGYSRRASEFLQEQDTKSKRQDKDMIDNLHFIKDLGLKSAAALEAGNLDEFADLMNETGMANHPDMVKTFARIGAAMGEDDSDTGGRAGAGAPKSEFERLKAMYPNSPELWGKE